MTRDVSGIRWAIVGMALLCLCILQASLVQAEETKIRVRVTGLFSPDREKDLRTLFAEWPEYKLSTVDFQYAEAVLEFDSGKLFPKAASDKVITALDNKVRGASQGTFGIKPLCMIPRDKLQRVEIKVEGLDCKACSLAAYEIVAKIEGVEQATSSFREGRITALIDPEKTQKTALEEALKKRGVTLKTPAPQ